jgi:hypothetical protein
MDVLESLTERALIGIDADDLRDLKGGLRSDRDLSDVLSRCVLGVSSDAEYWTNVTAPAPPITSRPQTWLEAHDIGDAKRLLLPGEATQGPSVAFWSIRTTDSRPQVVSFPVRGTRLLGALFHRRKECQEDYRKTGACLGTRGGCRCESSKSIEAGVIIDICDCVGS